MWFIWSCRCRTKHSASSSFQRPKRFKHWYSSVGLFFSDILLANCRIVSDMTQMTRRQYRVRTQLSQSQPMQLTKSGFSSEPFCEFMQRQCNKTLKMFGNSLSDATGIRPHQTLYFDSVSIIPNNQKAVFLTLAYWCREVTSFFFLKKIMRQKKTRGKNSLKCVLGLHHQKCWKRVK